MKNNKVIPIERVHLVRAEILNDFIIKYDTKDTKGGHALNKPKMINNYFCKDVITIRLANNLFRKNKSI